MKTLFEGKKLYAVIIGFLFIITFFITFHIIRTHYELVFKNAIAENKSTANLLSTLMYEHQKAAISVLESYAQRSLFIDAVKKKDFHRAVYHLQSLSKYHTEMDALFITDQYGTLWVNYPVDSKGFGKNLAYRDWYKGVSKKWRPYISSVYRLIVLEKGLAVALSVPVFDKKGKVIGIMNNGQRVSFLATFIRANTIDSAKSIALLDREGNIIFSNAVPYQEKITKYPDAHVLEKAVAGVVIDIEIADAREKGSISYVSIAPVRGIGWSVIVGQEKDTMLKQLYGYFIRCAATGFVIFLFLTVCILYFRREYKYRKTKELLQAEEAIREGEQRYHSLFENMLDGFAHCKMLFDDQDRPVDFVYLDVNSAFERLTGLKNVVGKPVSEVIPGLRELSPELFESYGRVALTGKPEKFEFDFKSFAQWLSISVYSTRKGYFVAVFENITDRKLAEEQTAASLKEKEALLKEIHHRVKNNMQIISSLLNMQSKYLTDPKVTDIFTACMGRIRSMALIHNKLYESESLARIDFADYVKDLASSLLQTYNTLGDIRLETDIDPLFLDIDTIIPLGLLVNELISNALKHAFPSLWAEGIEQRAESKGTGQPYIERKGEITITLKEHNGETARRRRAVYALRSTLYAINSHHRRQRHRLPGGDRLRQHDISGDAIGCHPGRSA